MFSIRVGRARVNEGSPTGYFILKITLQYSNVQMRTTSKTEWREREKIAEFIRNNAIDEITKNDTQG